MTIFQVYHDFVNEYKNGHHNSGTIESRTKPGVAGFLLFVYKIFYSYRWTASVMVCQKYR